MIVGHVFCSTLPILFMGQLLHAFKDKQIKQI